MLPSGIKLLSLPIQANALNRLCYGRSKIDSNPLGSADFLHVITMGLFSIPNIFPCMCCALLSCSQHACAFVRHMIWTHTYTHSHT